MTLRILVVGAGIAGLAAARGLRVAGFRPDVVEELPATTIPGAGIYLPGNATRALRLLGLDAPLRPARRPDLPAGLPGRRRPRAVRAGRRRALGRCRRVPRVVPGRPAAGPAHRGRRRGPVRHRRPRPADRRRRRQGRVRRRRRRRVRPGDRRRRPALDDPGQVRPGRPGGADRADRLSQRGQRRPAGQRLDRPARPPVVVRGDADGRAAAVLPRRRDGRPGQPNPADPMARVRELFGGFGGPVPAILEAMEKVQVARTDEVVLDALVHRPGAAGRRRRARHRADAGPGRGDGVRGRRGARRGAARHARRRAGRAGPVRGPPAAALRAGARADPGA